MSIHPVDYFYQINQVAADMHFALTGESRLKGLGFYICRFDTDKEILLHLFHTLAARTHFKIEGIESVPAMPTLLLYQLQKVLEMK